MSLFLTKNEIEVLTGRKRPDAQIRHLKRRGIEFELDANNHPVIIRQKLMTTTAQQNEVLEEPKLCFPKTRKKSCAVVKQTRTYRNASTTNTAHIGT